MQVVLQFFAMHWLYLIIPVGVVLLYALVQTLAVCFCGPRDTTGSGIVIGQAKVFDNRSLSLRIERLTAGLEALKTVSQNVAADSTFQGQTSAVSSRSITLDLKATPYKAANDGSPKPKDGDKNGRSASTAEPTKLDDKSAIALAASDILNDQLDLASQILSLEMLYERSLTDRLINSKPRLQTVLGFQVSITPPAGCENCSAIAEIGVSVAGGGVAAPPISLIALIPQEKVYNSQSTISTARSIGGSAVASILTLGMSDKGESRELFIHRDPDTIAFERNLSSEPHLFNRCSGAAVFGWEFRPVLGRATVSSGTRQMLAVIAIPVPEVKDEQEVILKIKTRSYWRYYNRNKQTSRIKWGLLPWKPDGSRKSESEVYSLAIPNTATIQKALAPHVTQVKWVNSGPDRATVIVKGSNFFSGTKVIIGGRVYSDGDGTLTLKSSQALEFETTVLSLATGDSVLSGRFGSSFKLMVPADIRPVRSLYVARATIKPFGYAKCFRVSIDVGGVDESGNSKDLRMCDLQELPDPILFVGTEQVLMPYDYTDINPDSGGSAQPGARRCVRVEAWIPASALSTNTSVTFRIPFCGTNYHTSQPLSFCEPSVTRMGCDGTESVFRIAHPLDIPDSIAVEIDRTYRKDSGLTRITSRDFLLRIATNIVARYQSMIIRIGDAESYVVAIPAETKPERRPTIDLTTKPPQVAKGSLGPVEWSGEGLDAVTTATLGTRRRVLAGEMSQAEQSLAAVEFVTYDDGKRIAIYFAEGSTEVLGKAEVEFQTSMGDVIRLPFFIVAKPLP